MLCVTVLVSVTTTSCTPKLREKFDPNQYDLFDPDMGLSRDDYRDMAAPKIPKRGEIINKVEKKPPPPPPLPDLQEMLAMPDLPEVGEEKLVSISVTSDVPLKDVLMELARLAGVDIELDSGITGGISFIARDKPFSKVVKRIAKMANLRYEMDGDVLRIERDIPYIQTYTLDFLNVQRDGTSAVNISTNVLSASGDGGGALNTGSSQSVSATTTSDFWGALQTGIEQILNYMPGNKLSQVQQFDMVNGEFRPSDNFGDDQDPNSQCAMGGASAAGDTMSGGNCRTFYSFNRQAGVLTVSASRRQHDMVMRYIERVKASASAQVLIEAKIVETELDDRYQSGIEWSALNNKLGMVSRFTPIDSTNGLFTLSLPDRAIDGFSGDIDGPNGADLDDFIQLLEEFGTTRTLSSPRLHAINNQQAVLTFAENLVYFELNIQRERDNSAGVNQELFTVESEAKTVPIGIILTMQPSVDMKTGEITLMVRPTLSRVTSFVNDPAVSFLLAQGSDIGIQNQIPVVEVRELDSILKVQSGQVMVIGGLMERTGTNQENGVPGIAGVPWIGNLFKSVDRREQTRELVILIKATLIGSEGKVGEADQNIYNKFSGDSRPLQF